MRVRDGKKAVHDGVKVEFVGSIGVSICHQFFWTSLIGYRRTIL